MQDMEQILQRLDEMNKRLLRLEEEVFSPKHREEHAEHVSATALPLISSHENIANKVKVDHDANNKAQNPIKQKRTILSAKSIKSDFEMEFGGKWINRIGIIALVFAVAFFLKYSFENNLVGPQGRIFIGTIFGISMLVSGDFLVKKYRTPSEGLIGGGIAVLCFTVYAAFGFYNFISQIAAFSLFVLIVLTSSFLAIRHDAVAIMHLGVLTGFLTPFLLAKGEPNDVFFLSYLVILNMGVMVIAYYKSWKSLFYLSFFATHLCYLYWMFDRAVINDAGTRTAMFLTGFIPMLVIYAEFLAVSLLMNISKQNKKAYVKFDFVLIFMNAMICYAEGYYLLQKYNDALLGLFTVIAALVYISVFYFIKKYEDADRRLLLSLLSLALIFVTIAIPVQLDGRFVTLAWSVEAIALAYISLRTEYQRIKAAYLSVTALTIAGLLIDLENISVNMTSIPFINIDSIVYIISVLGLFAVLWIIKESKSKVKVPLLIAVNLLLLGFFLVEASNIIDKSINTASIGYIGEQDMIENYSNMRNFIDSIIILLYSIVLISIGFFKGAKSIRILALALFLVVIFKVFLFDLSSLEGIFRILSFVALGFILLGISFVYQKFKNVILGGYAGEDGESD